MRPREWVRIHDTLEAITIAEQIVGEPGVDPRLSIVEKLALQRTIEIVSEASRHIPASAKAAHPSTPWRLIADIGNVLRHGYRDVDDKIILEVGQIDLPSLRVVLQQILAELDRPD